MATWSIAACSRRSSRHSLLRRTTRQRTDHFVLDLEASVFREPSTAAAPAPPRRQFRVTGVTRQTINTKVGARSCGPCDCDP